MDSDTTRVLAGLFAWAMIGLLVVAVVKGRRRAKATPPPALPDAPEYTGAFAFFRRHYNGDYTLGRSYWVNTLGVTLLAPIIGILVLSMVGDHLPARYGSAGVLALTAFGMALWFWAIRGTWASSSKHVQRGGASGWAAMAKVVIVLGVFKNIGDIGKMLPSLAEHARVASGDQLGPRTTFQLRADGRSLLLAGGINDGSAEELDATLALAPAVTTVVLASPGGWVREGRRLADVIRARGMNTYVEGHCESACTLAFLAGKERAAAPDAKIGFHASRTVGSVAEMSKAQSSPELHDLYRTAGVNDAFIRRILQTSHDSMWYPSHQEMLDAGILTRKSLGGETAALATAMRSREELEAEFKKTELFAALAERSPKDFNLVVGTAWSRVLRGATDAQVTVAARAELMVVLQRLLPTANDETLVAYQLLMQEQIEALRDIDAKACSELIFPAPQSMGPRNVMPKPLRQRELELLTRVVNEADPARAFKPSAAAVRRVAQRAALRMTPAQRVLFTDETQRRIAPASQACEAGLVYVTGTNAIPKTERAQALRTLYSSD